MKHTALLQLLRRNNPEESDEVITMRLAGREILIEQQPFVQSEIASARKVLNRLLDSSTSSKSSDYSTDCSYHIRKLKVYS